MNLNSIALGAGLGVLAARYPYLAQKIEFAAAQERTFAALVTLGVESANIERMKRFVVRLAQTQIVPNSEMIQAAHDFNLYRMALGHDDFLPNNIRAWALEFWRRDAAYLFDHEYRRAYGWGLAETGQVIAVRQRFVDDAERLWREL